MANTAVFFDTGFNQKLSVSINGNADVDGIYYDGVYFWTCEGTLINQYFLTAANTLTLVSSFDAAVVTSSSISNVSAICGDGVNLWIAVTAIISVDPLAFQRQIYLIDKSGHFLFHLTAANLSSVQPEYADISFRGESLFAYYTTNAAVNLMNQFDVYANKLTASIVAPRSLGAFAMDGLNFIAMRDNATGLSQYMDYNGKFLSVQVAAGFVPTGCDVGSGHQEVDGVLDWLQGEWIVAVHK